MRNITFVQSSSFQLNGRSTVSLGRKPSILEEGGSQTLFSCENWVNLWMEYSLPLHIISCEEHHLCAKQQLWRDGRNTLPLVSKTSILEAGMSSTLFPLRTQWYCERNTCNLKVFWSGTIIHDRKSTLFRGNGESHATYGKIQSVFEALGSHTLLSLWELSYLFKEILPSFPGLNCEEHNFLAN
jgi:hypothetical protein